MQFLNVLFRQSFVRSQNHDAVQLLGIVFLCIMQILFDVHMHHQCFTRTRCSPKRHLVQIVLRKHGHIVPCFRTLVEVMHQKCIDIIEQTLLVREIAVKIYLSKEQSQVLVILPRNLFFSPFVYLFCMFHYVAVILVELFFRYLIVVHVHPQCIEDA